MPDPGIDTYISNIQNTAELGIQPQQQNRPKNAGLSKTARQPTMLSCKSPIIYKVNKCEPKQYSSLHILYYMSGTGQTGDHGRSASQAANTSNNRRKRVSLGKPRMRHDHGVAGFALMCSSMPTRASLECNPKDGGRSSLLSCHPNRWHLRVPIQSLPEPILD
jgi:hypothetical protein